MNNNFSSGSLSQSLRYSSISIRPDLNQVLVLANLILPVSGSIGRYTQKNIWSFCQSIPVNNHLYSQIPFLYTHSNSPPPLYRKKKQYSRHLNTRRISTNSVARRYSFTHQLTNLTMPLSSPTQNLPTENPMGDPHLTKRAWDSNCRKPLLSPVSNQLLTVPRFRRAAMRVSRLSPPLPPLGGTVLTATQKKKCRLHPWRNPRDNNCSPVARLRV